MDDFTLKAEIKSYFDMAGFTNTADKKNPTADKFGRLLPISIDFLLSLGLGLDDIPNEHHIKLLDTFLRSVKNKSGKCYSESTINDWKRHTKNFFAYRHKSKGDNTMMTDNSIMGLEPELEITTSEKNSHQADVAQAHQQLEEISAENSAITAQPENYTKGAETDTAKKPGRPTKGKEERDKKITVNVPSALFDDIKDLANIDNVTIPDIINDIFQKAAQERAGDILTIRNLRAKRH